VALAPAPLLHEKRANCADDMRSCRGRLSLDPLQTVHVSLAQHQCRVGLLPRFIAKPLSRGGRRDELLVEARQRGQRAFDCRLRQLDAGQLGEIRRHVPGKWQRLQPVK